MTDSRQKGKRGELEIATIMRGYGFDARRGQQYNGANGDADVIGVPGIHIEVKRREQVSLDDWLDQATSDARDGETPVVMHRKSKKRWKAVLWLDDFMKMYCELLTLRKQVKELKMAVADLMTGVCDGEGR